MSKEELSLWYSAADIGVIPSYTEQCSYAALEMIRIGLPLVASDGFGLRDMFIDNVNAFVAHIGNILEVSNYAKRLSEAIECALVASDATIAGFAECNQKMLRNRYSVSSMAQSYINVFKEIVC